MVKECSKYTIESGFIYLNSILRGSILYGAETMLYIKEDDFWKLEQIEEEQMRLFFSTDRSCPIHLLYLEAGQLPARFQVKRMILNYLHYIMQQPENSLLYSMFLAQREKPVRNDFCQNALTIITEFGIEETLDQIKKHKKKHIYKNCQRKMHCNCISIPKKETERGNQRLRNYLQMPLYGRLPLSRGQYVP